VDGALAGGGVRRGEPARDELTIKLALAVTAPGVDIHDVIQRQRSASMRAMHEYTRLKAQATDDDFAWSLVLDNLVFATEAEVRWLDHMEARVARAAASVATAEPSAKGPGDGLDMAAERSSGADGASRTPDARSVR